MKKVGKLSMSYFIKEYIKRNRKNSMVILFLNVIYPIENSIYPILISKLVKHIKDFNKVDIFKILSYIVILNVVVIILYDLGIITRKKFESSLTSLILEETMNYVFKHERNIDRITNTELILTIKQYSINMCDHIECYVKIIIPSLFSVFYQMIYLYKVDYYLGNIFFILLVVMIYSISFVNKRCNIKLEELTKLENSLYEQVDEILLNLSTVLNNTDMQDFEIQKLRDITSEIKSKIASSVFCGNKNIYLSIFLIIIIICFVRRLYTQLILTKNIENATVSITILFYVIDNVKKYIYNLYEFSKSRAVLDLCYHTLMKLKYEKDGEDEDSSGGSDQEEDDPSVEQLAGETDRWNSGGSTPVDVHYGKNENAIEFKNISFKYGEKYIHNNLNISFLANKKNVLIGPNGVGKSTIFKLIIKNKIQNDGDIFYFGKSYSNISLKKIRKNIGVVVQKPVIFNNTISYNLLYCSDIKIDELERFILNIGLSDFFNVFPDRLETSVGKNGVKLSGGQLQIISIIRVLLSNKKIILLDEPTSSIDAINKKIIIDILSHPMYNNKTIIVITHDKELISIMDNIIEL
jgi:ABC-type multidrug transport system fused ATPase/permease subunit